MTEKSTGIQMEIEEEVEEELGEAIKKGVEAGRFVRESSVGFAEIGEEGVCKF